MHAQHLQGQAQQRHTLLFRSHSFLIQFRAWKGIWVWTAAAHIKRSRLKFCSEGCG